MASSDRIRRKGRVLMCLNCGRTFIATRRDARFDSVRCRVAYHRAKNTERNNTRQDEMRRADQQLRFERLFS